LKNSFFFAVGYIINFLEERRTLYEKLKTKIGCYAQIKKIPKLKKEKPELKEVYFQTL